MWTSFRRKRREEGGKEGERELRQGGGRLHAKVKVKSLLFDCAFRSSKTLSNVTFADRKKYKDEATCAHVDTIL